ncbi:MAG: hypothetical protein ABIZ52_06365 [Candidatus Limnocylindrales bacterium]
MTAADQVTAFAESRRAAVLLFGWGMFEAVVFFVIPDVLLYVLAAAAPRRAARLLAWTIAGALAGSVLLYVLAVARPDAAQGLLIAVPGIHRPMLDAAITKVAGGDPLALVQFGPGTPLKVYTVAWASGVGSILALLVGVVVNRLSRIGPGVVVSAVAGFVAPTLLRRFRLVLGIAYVVTWLVYYWVRLTG